MYDLIIIGGGPAGLTAAVYARRAGLSTLILEITVCGGQIINSQNVENFPSIRSVEGWRLADSWQKQAEALGAEIRTAQVTGIELEGNKKIIRTAKGDFEALAVIISTGAGHRKLGLYKPLVDFAGAGATVPLTGFGYSLAMGAIESVNRYGFWGAFSGGITRTAAGIAAALLFGLLNAFIFKPKAKD